MNGLLLRSLDYIFLRSLGTAPVDRVIVVQSGPSTGVLQYRLDAKIPQGKCIVPRYMFDHLGRDCAISFPLSLATIEELRLTPIAGKHMNRIPSVDYVRSYLFGQPLMDGQPVIISVGGEEISLNASCRPSLGWISKETLVTLTNNSSDAPSEVGQSLKLGFKGIGGLDSVVELILATVKKPLVDGEVYNKFGIEPPRGILLYGPPGTGKTLLAKCLSEELPGTYVKAVKATELTGNDADAKVHELFRSSTYEAKKYGKKSLLIFIDEVDALCPSRETASSDSERRAVAAVLTEMDGFSAKDHFPTVILGATNRPNSLDIALRRPGRFEREIEIPPPQKEGRVQILKIFAENQFPKIWKPSQEDLQEIASFTHGFVGADLLSLIKQAAFRSIESKRDMVTMVEIKYALNHVTPSALRELSISVPKTKWSHIGGYDDVKAHLIEAVIWPIKHEREFATMHVDPPKGVLLYGPPGCSKTMMARAAATESSMNFIAVKGPEVFSKWVGESEQAIRTIFQKARQASPCIVFFDEIDALGTQRDSSGDAGVGSRVLTQLLTEMDGLTIQKQIVVIAATNRPYTLDAALLRPGRFDRLVYVGLPDSEARKSIWNNTLSGVPHALYQWDEDYIAKLAAVSERYTGAEIVMIIKEAAINAIKRTVSATVPRIHDDLAAQLDQLSIEPLEELLLQYQDIQNVLVHMPPRTDIGLLKKLEDFRSHMNSNK